MDNNNLDLIDIDIDVESVLSGDEERWEELLDEIMAGNVIPVIGPDFQIADDKNFHTQLIDLFAKKFGVVNELNADNGPKTFSQLIYDKKFLSAAKKPDVIYKLIYQVLTKVVKRPSDLLLRLLGTKKFPFVITTSFTPVVENAMKQVWGEDNVNVLQFRNDPSRDLKPGEGDVPNIKEMSKPTVFYMFGKYSEEKNRYVVSDVDMMEFCKSWLADLKTPRVLTEAIKSRYLLVLGNNYSDWLFRFICYSLRSSAEGMRSSLLVNSSIDDNDPLIQFLNRLETFIQRDPEYVVCEIERRILKREALNKTEETKAMAYKNDVFLSYSRSDEAVVKKIFDSLSSRGLRVWYDRNDIKGGDNWRQAIIGGIKSSRVFVPILTSNVENEIMEAHEYRIEWKEAASLYNRMGSRTFIIPIVEKGFDFYNDLTEVPPEFSERNAVWYDISTDLSEIADVIEKKVAEVKSLEEKMSHGKSNN